MSTPLPAAPSPSASSLPATVVDVDLSTAAGRFSSNSNSPKLPPTPSAPGTAASTPIIHTTPSSFSHRYSSHPLRDRSKPFHMSGVHLNICGAGVSIDRGYICRCQDDIAHSKSPFFSSSTISGGSRSSGNLASSPSEALLDWKVIGKLMLLQSQVDDSHIPTILHSHSPQCLPVLIKTYLVDGQENYHAKLRYELMIHLKLHASVPTSSPCPPHLRRLLDGRTALILPDSGGQPLHEWVQSVPAFPSQLHAYNQSSSAPAASREQNLKRLPFTSSLTVSASPSLSASTSSSEVSSTHSSSATPVLSTASTAPSSPHDFIQYVRACLQVTVALCKALHSMHQLNLIHKSLSLDTVFYNDRTGSIQFIDLASASFLVEDRADIDLLSPSLSNANSWLYSAPEISGKANRTIDTRSDLYSVGAILFEILTGRPPFISNDTLELIHQHLARAPPMLMKLIPSPNNPLLIAVMKPLSAIISKLLQKDAEDRYQTVSGLLHDEQFILSATDEALATIAGQPELPVFALNIPSEAPMADPETLAAAAAAASTVSTVSTHEIVAHVISSLDKFQCGEFDFSSTFHRSQRLYGRQLELQSMLASYKRVCAQSSAKNDLTVAGVKVSTSLKVAPQAFIIGGVSGSGKSSLAEELHRHIVRTRGLYVRFKFDLPSSGRSTAATPSSTSSYESSAVSSPVSNVSRTRNGQSKQAFIQAFRTLLRQLIYSDSTSLWRNRISRALNSNAGVLVETLPELSRLLGEIQPITIPMSSAEFAALWNQMFVRLVSSLGCAGAPLCLILDDIQWASGDILTLLDMILSLDSAHILILGAYRIEEVNFQHPLHELLVEWRTALPDRFQEVTLRPLTLYHIQQLIRDSFHLEGAKDKHQLSRGPSPFTDEERGDSEPTDETRTLELSDEFAQLAQLLFLHTGGNAFFVHNLLKSCYKSSLITYDFGSTGGGNSGWKLDLSSIRKLLVDDDAISFLIHQMRHLTSHTQIVLQYAALIGNKLSLAHLALCAGVSILSDGLVEEGLLQLDNGTLGSLGLIISSLLELVQTGLLLCNSGVTDLILLDETLSAAASSNSAIVNPISASPPPPISFKQLTAIQLQFSHDKVQSAAYLTMSIDELSMRHCAIAKRLVSYYLSINPTESALFHGTTFEGSQTPQIPYSELAGNIVRHINLGCFSSRLSMHSTKMWTQFLNEVHVLNLVVALKFAVARQTKSLNDHDSALSIYCYTLKMIHLRHMRALNRDGEEFDIPKYLVDDASFDGSNAQSAVAIAALDETCWARWYADVIFCYREIEQCLCLVTDFKGAERLVPYVLKHISYSNLSQRADCAYFFELHIQAMNQQHHFADALKTGLEYLTIVGVEVIHEAPDEFMNWILGFDLKDESRYHLHPVFSIKKEATPESKNQMRLLAALTISSFFLGSHYLYSLSLTMAMLTRVEGITVEAAVAFGLFAMCLFRSNMLDANYALGRISQLILDSYGSEGLSMRGRVAVPLRTFVYPWKKHVREVHELLREAIVQANEVFDFEWQSNLSLNEGDMGFICNYPVTQSLVRQQQALQEVTKKKQLGAQAYLNLWIYFMRQLAHSYAENEQEVTSPPPVPSMPYFLLSYNLTQALYAYFTGRISVALDFSTKAQVYVSGTDGLSVYAESQFYHCLILLAACPKFDPSGSEKYDAALVCKHLSEADQLITRYRIWADHAPMNWLNKLQLMQAERNRVAIFSHLAHKELMLETMELYELAASTSNVNQFHIEEGLSYELYAKFFQQAGRNAIASNIISKSHNAYYEGECVLKTSLLESQFPTLHLPSASPSPAPSLARMTPLIRTRDLSTLQSGIATPTAPPAHLHQSRSQLSIDAVSLAAEARREENDGSSGSHHRKLSVPSVIFEPPTPTLGGALSIHVSPEMPMASPASAEFQGHSSFDVFSLLKATTSFSLEPNRRKLLKRLMAIVLETANASRGALVLLDSTKDWVVELRANVDSEDGDIATDGESSGFVTPSSSLNALADRAPWRSDSNTPHSVSPATALPAVLSNGSRIRIGEACEGTVESILPLSVFSYAIESKECVMLSNFASSVLKVAGNESAKTCMSFEDFSHDSYFSQSKPPKSLLCLPLQRASQIFGVLMLENTFSADAFSSTQIQLLQLLCSQASLSIDNARLYAQLQSNNVDLEQLVRQRTKELEERNSQLQQSKEQAEKATRIKAEFLSNMSHEIRTPMNAVLGVARLLSETNLSLEQQQYVSMITTSGRLLLTIINDILDYSKLEANQLRLHPVPSNLLDVCETCIMLCYDMASSKAIRLTWEVQPDLPRLSIDATRLQQILLNLLSNGLKFTRRGGVDLKVTGRIITDSPLVAQNPPVYELDFAVKDSGIGVSKQQLSTLFKSFSQVHSSSEYGGTGLGLVISKRLVEAMNGGIGCESEFGKGSTFHFTIVATSVPAPPVVVTSLTQSMTPSLISIAERQMHGLAQSQVQQLACANLIYVGVVDEASSIWIRLLEFYGSRVTCCATIAVAKEHLARAVETNAALFLASQQAAADACDNMTPTAPMPPVGALIFDLDTRGVTEEDAEDMLKDISPLRFLFLYSKGRVAPPEESTFIEEVPPPSSLLGILPPPLVHEYESKSAPAVNVPVVSLQQTASATATPSFSMNSYSGNQSSTPLQTPSDILSPSISGANATLRLPAQANLSRNITEANNTANNIVPITISTGPNATERSQIRSIRRCLRKPFRQRALLQALLSVLGSSLNPSSSPSSRESSAHSAVVTANASISGVSRNDGGESSRAGSKPTSRSSSDFSMLPQFELMPPPASITRLHSTPSQSSSSSGKVERLRNISHEYPLRVLLAEDNAINQKMMVMLMRKLGYELLLAANGREVLELLDREANKGREHEIDCILMDASMDVMDGIECTRVIRQQQLPQRKVPVIIAQTANVSEEYRTLCLDAGMSAFLAKPINAEELIRALKGAYAYHHPHGKSRSNSMENEHPSSDASKSAASTPASH